jgi:hypothetical protein
MKKTLILMLAALFAISFLAVACDDDDDDAAGGPCDELADAYQDAIDTVCDDFPDCSICEPAETDPDAEEPTDEECEALLDEFDEDATIESFTTICEMEDAAS